MEVASKAGKKVSETAITASKAMSTKCRLSSFSLPMKELQHCVFGGVGGGGNFGEKRLSFVMHWLHEKSIQGTQNHRDIIWKC